MEAEAGMCLGRAGAAGGSLCSWREGGCASMAFGVSLSPALLLEMDSGSEARTALPRRQPGSSKITHQLYRWVRL